MSKLIVIDGLDGSGKATQTKKIYEWLIENGYNAYQMSYPAYDSESSAAVKMYLHGEIGEDPIVLNPYMCSTFYAVDRIIQYHQKYKQYLDQDDAIVVSDRYISANVIHQGGKIKDLNERKEFFKWLYDFEVNKMGIPLETATIMLSMPVWLSQKLINERYNGDTEKKDIHEANVPYLSMCYDAASSAVDILNNEGYNWIKLDCLGSNNDAKSIEQTFSEVLEKVKMLIA